MRVVRSKLRIAKTSNSAKEGVIGFVVEKNGIRRNMRRCGRRETVDNEDDTLEHMILIGQGYRRMRISGKAKFYHMTMFSLGSPILLRSVWT
jgi:hypothetical protein